MHTTPAEVLMNLDHTMAMKQKEWLLEKITAGAPVDIIDLRSYSAWEKAHIPGSRQASIQELAENYTALLPDTFRDVIIVCNGSVQSAMAVVFLRTEGYENSYNLSGGFSGWQRAEFPIE